MNFRFLLLFAALGLSACNGSDFSDQQTNEGTFVPPVAVVDTGDTKAIGDTGGGKIIEPEPTAQQITRMKAADLQAQGKINEAALVLKEAGLISEAAGTFKSAGLDEEAYKLYAPEDYVVEDKTKYDGSAGAKLAAAVGNHDGYASFVEVQAFFDARSPLPAARARAAAKVQVVE